MTNPSLYIEPGYFEDGYVFSPCPVVLSSGSTRVDLRAPSGLSGSVRLLQPSEQTTGWARIGYNPRAVVHTLNLQYFRLNGDERNALDALFDTVDFSAVSFLYTDAATGDQFPVRFQAPEFSIGNPSYDKFTATLALWSATTFFTAPASPASISALLGAAHYPAPVKRAKKQPYTRLSDGSVVIYNKSTITRTTRTLNLVRMTRDGLASLIAHFLSVSGTKTGWGYDGHTYRYASSELTWQRSSVNTGRYDAQVSLEEDF